MARLRVRGIERVGLNKRCRRCKTCRPGEVEARQGSATEKRWAYTLCIVPCFLASYLVHGPDGTSIYFTRDVGGAIERYDQHKMLSSKQDLHMTQFIKMLDLMSFPWASSMEHVNYGVVVGHPKRDRRLPRPDHP